MTNVFYLLKSLHAPLILPVTIDLLAGLFFCFLASAFLLPLVAITLKTIITIALTFFSLLNVPIHIWKTAISYVVNQINNFIMVLIGNLDQQTKIQDSRTSQPKIRESELQRSTRKQDFETHSKRHWDFEIGTKITETPNFSGAIHLPSWVNSRHWINQSECALCFSYVNQSECALCFRYVINIICEFVIIKSLNWLRLSPDCARFPSNGTLVSPVERILVDELNERLIVGAT